MGILSVENLIYEDDEKGKPNSMEAFPSAEHYQVRDALRKKRDYVRIFSKMGRGVA